MVGVDDRRFDVKDILDRVTIGWVTPPNKPTLIVEDRDNPSSGFFGRQARSVANGVFFIKKDWDFERDKRCPTYENRLWDFPCMILSESMILLQGLFDQAREVFDRYTDTPWSTSTLGTSNTYDYAAIEKGTVDPRDPYYVMECRVLLLEELVAVVIA